MTFKPQGIIPALVTPLDQDGELLEQGLRDVLDYTIHLKADQHVSVAPRTRAGTKAVAGDVSQTAFTTVQSWTVTADSGQSRVYTVTAVRDHTEQTADEKFTPAEPADPGAALLVPTMPEADAGNVTTTPATSTKGTLNAIAVKGGALPERAYIFEMKDGNKRVRVVAPNFQITEVGDTQFVHSAATGYEVTGEALPNSSGAKLYIYTDDGVTTA